MIFPDPQKILVKRGGTHFFLQGEFNAIWSILKKSKAQKILLDRGGAQVNAQKILLDWGGTQIGTFWKINQKSKSSFSKIISSDFNILIFNFYNFAYI